MSLPRDEIVDGLGIFNGVGLPLEDVDILPYATSITEPAGKTLIVRLDEVLPHPEAPQKWNLYRFALILVTALTESGAADDDLDAFLEDVLFAIGKTGNITWSKATRATYQDTTYPAYEVTLDVPFQKE
jgi:hypothetical protein